MTTCQQNTWNMTRPRCEAAAEGVLTHPVLGPVALCTAHAGVFLRGGPSDPKWTRYDDAEPEA